MRSLYLDYNILCELQRQNDGRAGGVRDQIASMGYEVVVTTTHLYEACQRETVTRRRLLEFVAELAAPHGFLEHSQMSYLEVFKAIILVSEPPVANVRAAKEHLRRTWSGGVRPIAWPTFEEAKLDEIAESWRENCARNVFVQRHLVTARVPGDAMGYEEDTRHVRTVESLTTEQAFSKARAVDLNDRSSWWHKWEGAPLKQKMRELREVVEEELFRAYNRTWDVQQEALLGTREFSRLLGVKPDAQLQRAIRDRYSPVDTPIFYISHALAFIQPTVSTSEDKMTGNYADQDHVSRLPEFDHFVTGDAPLFARLKENPMRAVLAECGLQDKISKISLTGVVLDNLTNVLCSAS